MYVSVGVVLFILHGTIIGKFLRLILIYMYVHVRMYTVCLCCNIYKSHRHVAYVSCDCLTSRPEGCSQPILCVQGLFLMILIRMMAIWSTL